MNLITVECLRCHLEPVTIPEGSKLIGGICDQCIETENHQRQEYERARVLADKWESICPELYQDTQFDRLPHPTISQRALNWPYMLPSAPTKECPWMGLNLWGYPRTGKTRTLFLVLKKAHFAGKRIKFFGPSQFSQECELRNFKSASWIRDVVACDIVAFDDIDKCLLTKVQEDRFFSVLDARVARRAPTFFTGNTSGDALKLQFNNGESIVARIREHSASIHFPQQQNLL